jgi:hypothetical protein
MLLSLDNVTKRSPFLRVFDANPAGLLRNGLSHAKTRCRRPPSSSEHAIGLDADIMAPTLHSHDYCKQKISAGQPLSSKEPKPLGNNWHRLWTAKIASGLPPTPHNFSSTPTRYFDILICWPVF